MLNYLENLRKIEQQLGLGFLVDNTAFQEPRNSYILFTKTVLDNYYQLAEFIELAELTRAQFFVETCSKNK